MGRIIFLLIRTKYDVESIPLKWSFYWSMLHNCVIVTVYVLSEWNLYAFFDMPDLYFDSDSCK